MKRISTVVLSLFIFAAAQAGNLDEAEIRVTGIGDFCDPALHSSIAGTYQTDGREAPDIILQKDRFYGLGCLWYSFVKFDEGIPVFRYDGSLALPKECSKVSVHFRQKGSELYLFWYKSHRFYCAVSSGKGSPFRLLKTWDLPSDGITGNYTVEFEDEGKINVYYAGKDRSSVKPGNWRAADYRPYDATGVYRGGLSASSLWKQVLSLSEEETPTPEAVRLTNPEAIPGSISGIDYLTLGGRKGLIVGNQFGGFYWFDLSEENRAIGNRIVDGLGNAMRHPTVNPNPVAYVSKDADKPAVLSSCEGGVFFMKYTKPSTIDGKYVFEDPVSAREVNPALNAGSLVTPTVVDWDGDGKLDLVVGNSAGNVLFFHNKGSNRSTKFTRGEYVKAAGYVIHIQPGYGEDIQGPGESRWGYVGSNVYDWNEDGFLDILMNDSRGKHSVFLGTENGLLPEHPIYIGDLALHGTWRCRPGVGKLNGKTVYITLDDDDEFHLYFREDNYNLTEGFKLRLEDGRTIPANWLEAGGKGRVRFEVVDWDGDGVKDLIVATNKHNRIPAQDEDGLPWGRPKALQGATILFMKNVGTEAEPIYMKPAQLRYKGELIRLGHHGCGASAGYIGHISDGLPNLVAGDETGTLYLFERRYLSW